MEWELEFNAIKKPQLKGFLYFDKRLTFIGCCGEVLIALSSIDLVFEKGLSFLGIDTFGAFLGAPDFFALPEVIIYNRICT